MYFITGFEKIETDKYTMCNTGAVRTFGYYENEHDAMMSVEENNGDIYEYVYNYIVIEKIGAGIYPLVEKEIWYKWSEETNSYLIIEKPECTEHICNWAIG